MIFRRPATGLVIAAVAVSGVALTACKGTTTTGGTTIVTVTAPAPSTTPSPTGTGASSAAASSGSTGAQTSTRTAGPAPAGMTKLPGRCEQVLPSDQVAGAIKRDLPGTTAFVVGTADPNTGRVTYINCRYGIKGSNSDKRSLEIGVSLYRTAAQAAKRIPATVEDYQNNGAQAQKTTVDGIPATLLTGGQGNGYGPTVVLSYGQRTVAVTFADGAAPASSVRTDLLALASLAVRATNPR